MVQIYLLPGFSSQLLSWYQKEKRDLPWRQNKDPYRVWISEIMLQQTRVETVIDFYQRWMKKWPTIKSLSSAKENDVLKMWEGLGYYSRARNILKSAHLLKENNQSEMPSNLIELMELPGIGRYTAGAISSIAFENRDSLVDGNVARVLARIFMRSEPSNDPKGIKEFYRIADQLLPQKNIGDYNQALMELGATICTPQSPTCKKCPIKSKCRAFHESVVEQYPVRIKKSKMQKVHRVAGVIHKNGKVLMIQKKEKGLYYGMWEFPNFSVSGSRTRKEEMDLCFQGILEVKGVISSKKIEILHSYTKYRETIRVYEYICENVNSSKIEASWVSPDKIDEYPMASAHLKIMKWLKKNKI